MYKHNILPAILRALVFIPVSASANVATLNFNTFTESVYSNNISTSYWYNPIESSYSISLDLNTLQNFATTTAFNNNPNYTETVSTNINNGVGPSPSIEYLRAYGNINQTFNQFQNGGNLNRSMAISIGLNDSFSKHAEKGANYTGNLPASLIPTNTTNTTNYGSTSLSWEKSLGSNPNFVVYDKTQLSDLFASLLGQRFRFSQYTSTSACTQTSEWGCMNQTTLSNSSRNGYAVLSSFNIDPASSAVSQVPVPAAIWFFTSGLGMLGLRHRKKLAISPA